MPGFGYDIFRYNPLFSGVAVDADAQAFITAASITDPTQQSAVNQLVVDLKAASIWTKMKAVYPFVGGTAATHKFNLLNPVDSDAAFRLNFSGGWIHSVNGIEGNAVNTYADTFLNPTTHLGLDNSNVSLYVISDVTSDVYVDIGARSTAPSNRSIDMYARFTDGKWYARMNNETYTTISVANSKGMHSINRIAANELKLYKNGSNVATGATASSLLPNHSFYIGSLNNAGSSVNVSARQFAFCSIGSGLNATEQANLYTAVQAFQTTLSRNI